MMDLPAKAGRAFLALVLLGSALPESRAHAAAAKAQEQEQGSDDALRLADSALVPTTAASRDWTLDLEVGAGRSERRYEDSVTFARASFEFRLEATVAPAVSAIVSAYGVHEGPLSAVERGPSRAIVKEAYLSWRPSAARIIDLGRVNIHMGAARGYNPTDFFKTGAVEIATSADPESQRKNRLGTIMVRAEQHWANAALSLSLAPRLGEPRDPGDPSASGGIERTNSIDRWLLVGSHQVSAGLRPQWLVYGERGHNPQLGANLSYGFGSATVAYAEWAGGKSDQPGEPARGAAKTFRSRAAAGFTYTSPIDLSLTLELHFNGTGLTAAQEQRLGMNRWVLQQTLLSAAARQEVVTKRSVFAHIGWRNAFVRRFDIAGFVLNDTDDGGKQYWIEARRRFDRSDLTLQWQRRHGNPWTRFGAHPEESNARLFLNFYF